MMYACKLDARIPADHRVELRLPDDLPEGDAEIIVLMKATARSPAPDSPQSLKDFLVWLEKQPSAI